MANTFTGAKAIYHTRCVSLPSRAHPQTASLEDQLCGLRSSSAASASSSSICHNLGLLNDLYKSFDELLQLPNAQHALSHCHQFENALDGSLRLFDICSMVEDSLLIMKETLQTFEPSLRRRKSGESGHADGVQNFQVTRKNVKRIVDKCFQSMSKIEMCKFKMEIQGQHSEHVDLLAITRGFEAVNIPVLRSFLWFVFGTEEKSVLSKLIPSKQTGKQGEVMEKMDQAVEALKGGQKTEKIDLQTSESIIQELEEALECLFRQLLKSQVSLLNIFNH